jgi:hypothetical protein
LGLAVEVTCTGQVFGGTVMKDSWYPGLGVAGAWRLDTPTDQKEARICAWHKNYMTHAYFDLLTIRRMAR